MVVLQQNRLKIGKTKHMSKWVRRYGPLFATVRPDVISGSLDYNGGKHGGHPERKHDR